MSGYFGPEMLHAQKFRLGSWSPAAVQAPAFRVLDRMQHVDPALQIVSVAVALCAMAQAVGADMRDVIHVAENMLRDAEGPYHDNIKAIRAYAEGELRSVR